MPSFSAEGVPWTVRRPKPPHPGFWWAMLWCIGFVIFTQLPGGFIAAVLMFVIMALNPRMYTPEMLNDKAALLQSGPMSAVLAVTFVITELCVVGLSWLVIRLVVGRDWPRRLALRRPSLVHFLLVLASVPGLVLLANGSYYVLRN